MGWLFGRFMMEFKWKNVTAKLNSENIRFVLKQIEMKYPESTKNDLFEGDRERNGKPTDQLSGHKHDSFVAAVNHCASWILVHRALLNLRETFNEEYNAYNFKHCVERWISTSSRYKDQRIYIPVMAWITAAWFFGLEESPHKYPYYKISKKAIRRGSYSASYRQVDAVSCDSFTGCIGTNNIPLRRTGNGRNT